MARAKWLWALAVLAMLGMLAALVPMGFAGGQSVCPGTPTPEPTPPPDAPEGTDLSTDKIRLGLSIAGPLPEADATYTVWVTAKLNGYTLWKDITVTLSISSTSTATPGQDYETPTLPTITIKCGDKQATESFSLTIRQDSAIEPFYEKIVIGGTHDASDLDHIKVESDFLLIQDGQDGVPEPITNLAATIGTKSNSVWLAWSVPNVPGQQGPPTKYTLLRYSYVDPANGRRTDLTDSVCTNGSCVYEDTGLAYDTEYTYTVSAGNTSGWSTRVLATVTTGSAPGGV